MIRRWNAFWFRPAPLFDLAVCRIVIVGFQWFVVSSAYSYFVGAVSNPAFLYDPLLILIPFLWPLGTEFRPDETLLAAVFWITLGAGGAAFVGLLSRVSLWVFALGNIVLHGHAYSYGEIHHPDAIMMIALVALAMSPAGKALSVDAAWKRWREQGKESVSVCENQGEVGTFSRWPLKLIQVLFVFVYFDAAMSKLVESGLDWLNGYTLQYYLAQDGMRWGSDLGVWMSRHHVLSIVSSVGTFLFELSFVMVILFPRLALIYLPVGLALHAGIYFTMKAPFFTYMVLYAVFVPWSIVFRHRIWNRMRILLGLSSKNRSIETL